MPRQATQPAARGKTWYQKVNWLNMTLIAGLPLAGCAAAYWTPLTRATLAWSIIYYFMTGLGITAGYHRLWAHTSYSATLPLRVFLALAGAGSVEGSIRWWARDHRAHHRYTDTDKDPYSVRKGLLYSHIGWLVLKQDPKRIGRSDISDLNADPIVRWQHRNYLVLVILMSLVVPTAVAGLWGDVRGGLVYAGILRMFFVQQATFCVNSLAHWLGDQPFDDRDSPRDHVITALLTLGEGYHNFHHQFPSDYRNAIKAYHYDPTKWVIALWKFLGLAYDLKTFPSNEIEKGRVLQDEKKLNQRKKKLDWGVPLDKLPVMGWDDYVAQCGDGKPLISICGIVHDVGDFIARHPGGRAMISSAIGKDATAMFNGGVYDHSTAAHNLLASMRVGIIRGGGEVEIWKRQHLEEQKLPLAGVQVTKISATGAAAIAA